VRAFLASDLIDYLHVVIVPVVLGRGEPMWEGLDGIEDRFHVESVTTRAASST
jgi:dihydrofolate reductase